MNSNAFSGQARPNSPWTILLILGVIWLGCGIAGVYTGAETVREIDSGQPAILWMQPSLFLAVFLAPFAMPPIFLVLRLFVKSQPNNQRSVGPGVLSVFVAVVCLAAAFTISTNRMISKHDYEVCVTGYGKYSTSTLMRASLIASGGCSKGRVRSWLL